MISPVCSLPEGLWTLLGERRPPLFTLRTWRARPAARIRAPHKQLHIWAGRDASGKPRGGWGPTARRVNERGPEGDGGRWAPVVLLAAFRRRLMLLKKKKKRKKKLSNLFLLFCSHPSLFVSAFAYDFKTENKKQSWSRWSYVGDPPPVYFGFKLHKTFQWK